MYRCSTFTQRPLDRFNVKAPEYYFGDNDYINFLQKLLFISVFRKIGKVITQSCPKTNPSLR